MCTLRHWRPRRNLLHFMVWWIQDRDIIRGGFLSVERRNKLIALARNGSAASRVTRRAIIAGAVPGRRSSDPCDDQWSS
jgi:hypothetical protein